MAPDRSNFALIGRPAVQVDITDQKAENEHRPVLPGLMAFKALGRPSG